nr:HesA/MoeB/ThiF family protein [Myroides phaeus]
MDTADFLRYSRQMALDSIGVEGQLLIKNAKVLVIGAGGLGSPILTYLATCGVGNLAVVDFDVIEEHNLHRQILFTPKNIGVAKTAIAKQQIYNLNPNIVFTAYNEKLTIENIEKLFSLYDYIIDGSDNFQTRYLVNDYCVKLNKTLIYGTILGFQGQLAVFNHNKSKNLRDLFPEPPNESDVPNCSLNGVLGTFPGIIGTMMAQEALKVIIGLPHLNNQLLIIDTLHWEVQKLSF